jgi:hypothetical protein
MSHTRIEQARIILASDSELAGESEQRVEYYRRYWSIDSWDPDKKSLTWKYTEAAILESTGTSSGKGRKVLQTHPIRVESVFCVGCGGPLWLYLRLQVRQVLRGTPVHCDSCIRARHQEAVQRAEKRHRAIMREERKVRAAFKADLCADPVPERCVEALSDSQVGLYLKMAEAYRDKQNGWWLPDWDSCSIVLSGPYSPTPSSNEYEGSGPDLYELARHRMIDPVGTLALSISLTTDGHIDPSGYPYVSWEVAEEIHSQPLFELISKRLPAR